MEANPVRWFEIYVQDMSRAKKFYESVLGVKLQKLESPESVEQRHSGFEIWGFPMLKGSAGCAGALVRMPGFPSGGGGTLVYFGSNDCAIELSRVAKAGGKVEREKFSIGQYGFIGLANDTEGNMFGVHSIE